MNPQNLAPACTYNKGGPRAGCFRPYKKGDQFVKRALSALLLSLALSLAAFAQAARIEVSTVVSNPSEIRQITFDTVWRTVKEKHFDPTFGGVDWDKVREKYLPRAAAAKTDAELHEILQQMLGELGQSHFGILPPEAVASDAASLQKEGDIGIDVRALDGRIVITGVEEKSKASAAGLKTGFIIEEIDGQPAQKIFERFSKSKLSAATANLYITRLALGRINGKPGTSVRLAYLDGGDKRLEAMIEREKLRGEFSPPFGNFPPQHMKFESRRLAGNIGYIRFNIWVIPMMERIREAIRAHSSASGIIIDLRGNPGGVGAMAPAVAGQLETKQVSLGTMRMRAGHTNFVAFPQPNAYKGPVVILIDGLSASTSEVFASGMQDTGRALIVGETSVGAALPSVLERLPTGAVFQYAIADFRTPRGILIEGRGVVPDVEVKLSRGQLIEGRDPQLDEAIKQLNKRMKSAASGE
jgi:carboxyl-terminal processing protease